LFGMKAWPALRWPIRMRGTAESRRTRISVAESFGCRTLVWIFDPASSGWS